MGWGKNSMQVSLNILILSYKFNGKKVLILKKKIGVSADCRDLIKYGVKVF